MNETEDSGEFTTEEKVLGVKIFRTLYKTSLVLPLSAIFLQLYFGFHGYFPWIVIPLWAVMWFCFRVIRRYLYNMWTEFYNELEAEQAQTLDAAQPNLYDIEEPRPFPNGISQIVKLYEHNASRAFPSNFKLPSALQKITTNLLLKVYAIMIVVSAFWYGVGTMASALFGDR